MNEQLTEQLKQLRALWQPLIGSSAAGALPEALAAFQIRTGYLLPADLRRYFIELVGTERMYDKNFFRFNGLAEFKSVDDELRFWGGTPDYTGIVDTLPDYQDCFVLADWSIQCVTYPIRLHQQAGGINEVYAICGDVCGVVGASFTEFLAAYLDDWQNVLI